MKNKIGNAQNAGQTPVLLDLENNTKGNKGKLVERELDIFGPKVVRRDFRAVPALAISIGSHASEEVVVRLLEDCQPGRWFRVLDPL